MKKTKQLLLYLFFLLFQTSDLYCAETFFDKTKWKVNYNSVSDYAVEYTKEANVEKPLNVNIPFYLNNIGKNVGQSQIDVNSYTNSKAIRFVRGFSSPQSTVSIDTMELGSANSGFPEIVLSGLINAEELNSLPFGLIAMWNSGLTSVPQGWAYANGDKYDCSKCPTQYDQSDTTINSYYNNSQIYTTADFRGGFMAIKGTTNQVTNFTGEINQAIPQENFNFNQSTFQKTIEHSAVGGSIALTTHTGYGNVFVYNCDDGSYQRRKVDSENTSFYSHNHTLSVSNANHEHQLTIGMNIKDRNTYPNYKVMVFIEKLPCFSCVKKED